MIRLNSNKREKEQILNLIKKSINHKELELECLIMNNIYNNESIDYNQFINVIKRLKNKKNYQKTKSTTYLDIYFPLDTKYRDVRARIYGYGAVFNYCNQENINNILENVSFQKKTIGKDKDKLNIPNYNIRFNLKKEVLIDKDESIIRDLIREWKDIPKNYRYKTQNISYKTIDNEFSIDVSIIKSSTKREHYLTINEVLSRNLLNKVIKPSDIRIPFSEWWNKISKNKDEKVLVSDIKLFYKNIQESGVFTNLPDYEVEVEFIGNQKDISINSVKQLDEKINHIFINFFKQIGIVMQAIQGSFYLISNSEKMNLVKNMQNMINKIIRSNNSEFHKQKRNNNSSNKKTNDNDTDDSEEEDNNLTLTKIKDRVSITAERLFFGPLAIDLSYNNIIPIQSGTLDADKISTNNNIRLNYVVTDKADGERHLLVINDSGKCYGVNRNNKIKYFGITLPKFANSIFDVEYITKMENGRLCNNIYVFDCYICEGKYMMNKPFYWNKENGRYHCLYKLDKYVKSSKDIINDDVKFPTMIFIKQYYPSDNPKTINKTEVPQIFNSCKQLLNKMNVKYGGLMEDGHHFSYATDGLIFLPNNLAIYQEYSNDKIFNPFVSKTWYMNYKWKNSNDLTIDFKVNFVRKIDTNTIHYIYINDKRYVQLNLFSKVYQKSFPNQLNYYLLNEGLKASTIPEEFMFQPSYPFYGEYDDDRNLINTCGVCYLEVDNNDNIYCENKDIVVDKSMVEFRYDLSKPKEFRWVPVRNRMNFNNFITASETWKLIHNPIRKEIITTDYNELETNTEILPYYSSNLHEHYKTEPLKKFSNFAKNYLIERTMSGTHKPFVLDLACGKMGDYFKYVLHGAFLLIGIDINPDNIHNKLDGAATRIYTNMDRNPNIGKLASRTILINGDVNKNIQNGDCAIDEINRYYLDVLYGRVKSKNYKLNRMFNMASEGFNVVTCMYSIHYMMNNEEDFGNFLSNVSDNLREGGYFVGTCLDGNELLKMFKGVDQVIGEVDGKMVYKIEKVEEQDYDSITLGNKIRIYFETFGGMFEENLVDIDYFSQKAEEYNLKLVETSMFLEEPGNLLSQYEGKNKEDVELINKHNDLLSWAQLNRYFIFQKAF